MVTLDQLLEAAKNITRRQASMPGRLRLCLICHCMPGVEAHSHPACIALEAAIIAAEEAS